MSPVVPQPDPSRLTPFGGHPIVVGVVPGQPVLVALTAASLAAATGATIYFAYVDPSRMTLAEHPDGTVRHTALDPDGIDDWQQLEASLRDGLRAVLAGHEVVWEFRYLAGRPDRALTHLARAVDAAVIVVGTRTPGSAGRIRGVLEGAVATHLSHHQHRPVIVVPTEVVDWKTPLEWH